MWLMSCSGYTKPHSTAPLTFTSHLHPSLIPVQRAAALFHMDLLTLFCHKGCIRVKNNLLYFAVNPKHYRASREPLKDSGFQLSTVLCDRSIQNQHKSTIEIRIRTFKVPSPKIHMNSNILHIRQEVMLGQAKGPHLACRVTWQGKEPRHWAATLGATSCGSMQALEPQRALAWLADPAASGMRGYESKAAALCCKGEQHRFYCMQEESHTQGAGLNSHKHTCLSRGTGDLCPGSAFSLQQHSKELTETPQQFPRSPKYRDARVKLPSSQH